MVNRAQLPKTLQRVRDLAPELVDIMERETSWYASVAIEDKEKRNYRSDSRQASTSREETLGARLRIYDGNTFFETATNDLTKKSLVRTAKRLRRKVKKEGVATGDRPYTPPSWEERNVSTLDAEISSQIPENVTAETPVHFGVRYLIDPFEKNSQTLLEQCQAQRELMEGLAKEEHPLSNVIAILSLTSESHIFVDRSVNLSQTLLRVREIVAGIMGAEQQYVINGGLGGLEIASSSENDMQQAVDMLVRLQTPERLVPGKYPIITGPGVTGILAHEAFGHSQEGDTWARGRSKAQDLFHNRIRVGNNLATILNNPAMFTNGVKDYGPVGSYFFDNEGWFAREQIILDKGFLQLPMTNLSSALRLNVPRTANGKREAWSHADYARQTNTYFVAGNKTLQELISQIEYGFLAMKPAGGMEDPKGMGIQVGVSFLEEIKNGKLTGRIFKGPAGGDIQITGYVPDILNNMRDVSKIAYWTSDADTAVHPENKVGGCGKYHKEIVVAGCGGPCILIDGALLG